ncbi:MAG: transglycosylase SLT domain-containing protein [Acidobacteria bacterium]|nr:transglycosylase SLT domain-containing protein [Acidobacteriota bacterium]
MPKIATLETEITVDNRKAKASLIDFEAAAKRLGGSSSLGNILGDANSKFGSLEASVGTAKSALGSIPIPAAAAAAAVAGIGVAAVGAGKELFNLAKEGSDLGRTFASFEAKTGLSAQAVSTLSMAANESGKELSDLQRPLVAFNELLYKAQHGSENAAAALHKMGVTDLKTLDGALDQVSKAFNDSAAGQDKLHAAVEIFGKKGGPDFISVMSKMKGGFKEAQREAERLGVTLSEDDLRAAKEFGQAYDVVSEQIKVGVAKFALQYAPAITGAIRDISQWVASNKDEWLHWGSAIGGVVAGVVGGLRDMINFVAEHKTAFRVLLALTTMGGSEALAASLDSISTAGASRMGTSSSTLQTGGSVFGTSPVDKFLDSMDGDKGGGKGGRSGGGAGKSAKSNLPAFGSMTHLVLTTGNAQWDAWFAEMGAKWHVDPNVLLLQAGTESTYQSGAVSPKGAHGFSQFMPGTADRFHVDTSSVKDSIRGQAQYMAQLLSMFGGDYSKALAGYNAGEGNIQKYGGIPPFAETRKYVSAIKSKYAARVGKGAGEYGTYDPSSQEDELKKENDARIASIDKFLAEWMAHEKAAMQDRLELRQGEANLAEEILKKQLAQGTIDEREYNDRIGQLKIDMLQDERDELAKQEGTAERNHKLALLDLQIATAREAKEAAIAEDIAKQNKEYAEMVGGLQKKNQRPGTLQQRQAKPDWKGSVMGGLGIGLPELKDATGQIKSQADVIKSVYGDIADFAGGAIGSMVGGLADLAVQWIITGQASGKAAMAMLASSAFHIATESLFKGIFELAEAAAAAARYDFYAAAAHKVASGIYFKVAAVAGAAGVGFALAGRAMGGGKGGTSSGSASGGSASAASSKPADPVTYSRASDHAYYSGRDAAISRLADAVEKQNDMLDSMRPGDVLTRGIKEKPGVIGVTAVSDIKRNSGIGRDLGRTMGF